MSRTTTIMSDFQKMALMPSAASIILKMMMACNDMQTANEALSYWKEKRVQQPTSRAHGAGMYYIRLQISHLNEALKIIDRVKDEPSLLNLLSRCDRHTQEAFSQLSEAKTNHAHISVIAKLRNNLGFHYLDKQGSDKWIKKAVIERSAGSGRRHSAVTRGLTCYDWYFKPGDDISHDIVVKEILGISGEDLDDSEKDEILRELHAIFILFMDFAGEFIWKFCEQN
jgi:hypothetical protein